MTVFQPADARQAEEIVAQAAAAGQSLEIVAGGSKRGWGRVARTEGRLDVSKLAGIVDYDPAELVLTARAATPLREIEAQLAARRQMLAFEPPDWRELLENPGEPTLGGVFACNMAGPRRVRAGAARDYILGFAAIDGRGQSWKAGGKVVKNVTGYDMAKLQAGAFGTLSLLTEITLKVMPRPETSATLLLPRETDTAAIEAASQALNTPYEVSAAAYLPQPLAARSSIAAVAAAATGVLALRIEGFPASVAFRADAVEALLGVGTRLDAEAGERLWAEIGAVWPLIDGRPCLVWRLCPPPAAAPGIIQALRQAFASARAFYDWGGGLAWLALDPEEAGADAGAAIIRRTMQPTGGHATLIRASAEIRARVPVFEPMPGPLAALAKRIKAGFDPQGILNPGRVWEDR